MSIAKNKFINKYGILLLIVVSCLFIFTAGQSVPIYLKSYGLRDLYYFIVLGLLVITTGRLLFKIVYNPAKDNIIVARVVATIVGGIMLFIFGIWTIGLAFSGWSDAYTYWVRKDNPHIKIVSAYVNEGAFGGGEEASDYHIVLLRPFLYIFKIETAIDTSSINKNDWKIPDLYDANDIKGIWYECSVDSSNQVLNFGDSTLIIKDSGTAVTFNYKIDYDSIDIWKPHSDQKMKNKIITYSDSDLMFMDSRNKTKGERLYFRTKQ